MHSTLTRRRSGIFIVNFEHILTIETLEQGVKYVQS